jgi:hypothetical protein
LIVSAHAAVSAQSPPRIAVPKGATPTIDGRIAPDEWAGSAEARLPDESRVLLRHDDQFLYIGIVGAKAGFPSICVSRGDSIRILHSSAALGSALYVRDGDAWQQRSKFNFALRSGDVSAAGMKAIADYLNANGWVATNSAMSPSQREMQISLSMLERNDPILALGYYVANDGPVLPWPHDTEDGCTATKTVQGWLPPTLLFRQTSWARLTLAP